MKKQVSKKGSKIYQALDKNIKEDFCFLFTGTWLNGDFGHDRKNVGLLIKIFLETFKNKSKQPALILKTTTLGCSYKDRHELLRRIEAIRESSKSNNLPNIYLFHDEISDEEMNELYNHPKVKAMVNLTKGEGFGRPLLEFSLTNKPIITTNWSGHIDYLKPEFATLLPGKLEKIHPSASNKWLLPEAEWFTVDNAHVNHYLKDVFENYKTYAEKGKRQGYHSRTNFSLEKMKEKLKQVLDEIPMQPSFIPLNLPKLNQLPKLVTQK